MGLRLFFLSNFPGATFIQGAMFIPDSRVTGPHGTSNFDHQSLIYSDLNYTNAESAYVKVLITKLRSNLCCTYYILKHAKVLKLDSDM